MKLHTALASLLVAAGVAYAQPGQTPPADPAGAGSGSAAPAPAPAPAPGGDQRPTPTGQPNAPGVPAKPVNTTPIQLTPKELDELKETEAEYDRFLKAANDHDTRMRLIAKREFDSRTEELQKRYADRIAKTLADKQKRHGETIALLEKFLKNHPHHDQFTPDAMFRLADLYLDRAEQEVEAKLDAMTAVGGNANNSNVVADYTPATDLWEAILRDFPQYRQTPATLYLLAYYGKSKDERKSLTVFLALTCANHFKWNDAPSKAPTREEAIKRAERKQVRDPYADCTAYPGSDLELTRHAWVRGIADYHFTIPGELDEAIAAYLKVANGGQDSKLYAESLYKLAWSYYKRDFLEEAIRRFDESVKLYDSVVAQGGQPALELRDESIQYIAVAFTDPWEGETNTDPNKAFDRAKNFYKGRENEPHVRDVWVAMGKAFTDIQAWDRAVDSYRIAIGPPWELNPKNPLVHQEIVNVYEAKGDKLAADTAAAELATKYSCSPMTAWCKANEKDREAMDTQRRIAERALYAAARNTHSAATQARKDYEASKAKDPADKQSYLALYNKAVELYKTFIATYPESDYIYEFNYNTGEALYWSERYLEAIESYKWVRDHRDMGTAFYLDSARSILNAYEKEVEKQVAANTIKPLEVPSVEDLKKQLAANGGRFQPQPIPAVYVSLQAEYDNFQNVVNDPAEAPRQGANAARISLAYFHIDDAISRFQKVMDKFCGNPEVTKSKDAILAIYQAQDRFDDISAVNQKFITSKCGDQKSIDAAIVQLRSLKFDRANKLFADKAYAQAADLYYGFYKTAPPKDKDLPVALYNAAIGYKLADRPKTAIALFKEFADQKDPAYRNSPYYLDALRLQAATYQSAFDYNNAIQTYLDLYATTKRAKAAGIKAPEPLPGEKPRTLEQIGLDALYNAALASELNRDSKRAIELWGQYERVETDRRKQDRAHWSIVQLYRQAGDVNSMSEEADKWRRRYGNDGGNEDDYVQTFYDESQIRKRKGQTGLANKAGQETIDAWKKKGSQKNTKGAKFAGEWTLSFAEDAYTTWDKLEIKNAANTVPQAQAQNKTLTDAKAKIEDKYLALDPYGVAELTMAAKVRFGDIQFGYGLKVQNVPVPTPIEKAGGTVLEKFLNTRDENLKKYATEARAQWTEVVDLAKKGGISNKWSRLALEDLGREFPGEFTPLRQELVQGTDAP